MGSRAPTGGRTWPCAGGLLPRRDAPGGRAAGRGRLAHATPPDGTVECVFEGPAEAVEAMVAFVRGGPGHAEVTSVDVTEEEPEGLSGFEPPDAALTFRRGRARSVVGRGSRHPASPAARARPDGARDRRQRRRRRSRDRRVPGPADRGGRRRARRGGGRDRDRRARARARAERGRRRVRAQRVREGQSRGRDRVHRQGAGGGRVLRHQGRRGLRRRERPPGQGARRGCSARDRAPPCTTSCGR